MRQPGSAASELAPSTSLGTETIARTLAALEAAGLAERGAARDDGYHPMPPDLAFESVLLERARQLREARELVHSLTARYSAVSAGRGRDAGVVELISGHRTDGRGEDLDRLILRLLAVGLTDRAVARQLNLSQRTVQRHVATLMTRLGARTRLQAGVQGIRQGWL